MAVPEGEGPAHAAHTVALPVTGAALPAHVPVEVRAAALLALTLRDPAGKAALARTLDDASRPLDPATRLVLGPDVPGRPAKPRLVMPRDVSPRGALDPAARASLIHALAHIEFNAINLALDAAARFAGLPEAYYRDWLRVASEEALHFLLLDDRLRALGHAYGDFDAHDGLWQMAERTRDDVLARMALVPRTLEARGLDASPRIRDRLMSAGDPATAAVLDVILRDEITHVRIGNHWFRELCVARGEDPPVTYRRLASLHGAPRLRGPFNIAARRAAGFTEAELALLLAAER